MAITGTLADTTAPSLSFGESEEDEQCSVKPDEIFIGETAEMIAHVRPWHRGDLVDHDLAGVLDSGGGRGFCRDSGQRRLDGLVVSGQTVTEAVASNRSS